MRILRFWAFAFAALASMALGVEAERFLTSDTPDVSAAPDKKIPPGVRTRPSETLGRILEWQPLSTQELWQRMNPESLSFVEETGREQMDPGIWDSGVGTLLALPPAAWLSALALLLFLGVRLRSRRHVPEMGGLRSGVRSAGILLAGLGFAVLGADLFRAAGEWDPRSLADLWASVNSGGLAWARESFVAPGLEWSAWLSLIGAGLTFAFLARPRPQPGAVMLASGGALVEPRYVDLTRTLAYLDSIRSWPPRSRRSRGAAARESHPLE